MAKKKKGTGVFFVGVNSVTVGPCSNGAVTVTADVTIPLGATTPTVNASIVPAAGGPAVAGPVLLLMLAAPSTYSGRVMGIAGPGPFKAKVDALWMQPTSSTLTSNQFNCTMGPPTAMGAGGADDCCG